MTSAAPQFDVMVVGGGMVGTAAACGLADLGLQVALIENQAPQLHWPEGEIDLRVSAINHASRHLLQHLGAWERIAPRDAYAYRHMRVWDEPAHQLHFDSAEIAAPALGHIVQNRVIQAALWQAASTRAGITMFCPASVAQIRITDDQISAQLTEGQSLSATVLVGADGAKSRMRDLLGIATSRHDFHQSAVVATVRFAADAPGHRDTAWQRFLPTGPLAFLPISADQCSIVWSSTDAEQLLQLDDAAFCNALSEASQQQLGRIAETSARAAFPLASIHAERYVQPQAVLIGDAAHQIHPLAGQGVNLGFRDVCALLAVTANNQQKQRPLGSLHSLRPYERARRGDNLLMQKSMEGFNALFSNSNPLLKHLRNQGLSLTQGSDSLKTLFIQHALGLSDDLPSFCRAG